MKLRGYNLLMDIRRAGYRPSHVCLYMHPVRILPVTHDFIDPTLCTLDETSDLADYELDALRGIDVLICGRKKDDRLRNACKLLTRLARSLIVTSDEHDGVDCFQNGVWL